MTIPEKINQLHNEAMSYADLAFSAKKQQNEQAAQAYFRLAYEKEAAAAALVVNTSLEPTRSVLHRSAATLALDCGAYRAAEKLVATALAGNPPEAIAQELRELMARILQIFDIHTPATGD